MAQKYLIVEGYFDKLFYQSLLKKVSLKNIEIVMPTDGTSYYNGKGNSVKMLSTLLPQFNDGTADRILIILDADFDYISNQGFHATLRLVNEELKKHGYDISTRSCDYQNGIEYRNDNGLPNVGLWIMPNNSAEGYLEYLIFDSLSDSKDSAKTEAVAICGKLENVSFSEHHQKKSELAIFMSMQENPGRNITHIIENEYIDFEKDKIKQLIRFLEGYFN